MFSYNRYDNPWLSIATSVTATALVAATGYSVFQLVQAYGWEGALSYIWEGDPFPPHVRERMHTLEGIEKKLNKKEKSLSQMEECLERARLDSVDESAPSHIRSLWEKNYAKDLRKALSLLSYDLDQIASSIDGVSSKEQVEIKSRKKALSTRCVKLMDRADVLMKVYKTG